MVAGFLGVWQDKIRPLCLLDAQARLPVVSYVLLLVAACLLFCTYDFAGSDVVLSIVKYIWALYYVLRCCVVLRECSGGEMLLLMVARLCGPVRLCLDCNVNQSLARALMLEWLFLYLDSGCCALAWACEWRTGLAADGFSGSLRVEGLPASGAYETYVAGADVGCCDTGKELASLRCVIRRQGLQIPVRGHFNPISEICNTQSTSQLRLPAAYPEVFSNRPRTGPQQCYGNTRPAGPACISNHRCIIISHTSAATIKLHHNICTTSPESNALHQINTQVSHPVQPGNDLPNATYNSSMQSQKQHP
ncbi:hypothetical protein Nepgr_017992 [Nepenthes gracilis]|uniref:Uncharacterized protein n=1 Tax=Nepenthes gracilis TaxID=150966 RepID=A0AAD3ST07_NEPGR|nr:hypothetical protein Nepgr_017992 [Nepenthes gracilis]